MEKVFYCYSIQLKNFLKLQGLRYEGKGKHKNGNTFWTFISSDELNAALAKWTVYKAHFEKK